MKYYTQVVKNIEAANSIAQQIRNPAQSVHGEGIEKIGFNDKPYAVVRFTCLEQNVRAVLQLIVELNKG